MILADYIKQQKLKDKMDIVQLYQDHNVDFMTEGHPHCRPGWVNTVCPFCTGNPGYHLSSP